MKRGREREAFHNLSRCEPWHLIYFTKRTADAHIFMSWDLEFLLPLHLSPVLQPMEMHSPAGSLESPLPLSYAISQGTSLPSAAALGRKDLSS